AGYVETADLKDEPALEAGSLPHAEVTPLAEAACQDDSVHVSLDEMELPATAGDEPPAAGAPGAPDEPESRSHQAGGQVAAAFGELSEVFAASRRRSFDEMAEEMLRPMLQDWLDNNLPTLVEKLVREEIERVARGGQG